MRRFHRLFIVLLGLACGCNQQRAIRNVTDALVTQPDPTVELLESELRWMEDNLYQLDAQLEASKRQLDSTRRENAALRLELAEQPRVRNETSQNESDQPTEPTLSKQNQAEGYDEESLTDDDLLDFAPKIELGTPERNESNRDPTQRSRQDRSGQMKQDSLAPQTTNPGTSPPPSQTTNPLDPPADADTPPVILPETLKLPEGTEFDESQPNALPRQPADDPPLIEPFENPFLDDPEADQVLRIELNEKLTGGFNADRVVGHDGVMVVIEPMDARANYVPLAGAVTVTLRDPSQENVQGLVGKWKFSADEVAGMMKKTLLAQGIHLELPWPHGAPSVDRLDLMVEYESHTGKQLRASRKIQIVPSTQALVNRATTATAKSWYADRSQTR